MEEEIVGKAYDSRLMRRLLAYMWPYRIPVAAALVCLLVNAVLQIVGPLLTKLAVAKYFATPRKPTPLDWVLSPEPWTGITQISLL